MSACADCARTCRSLNASVQSNPPPVPTSKSIHPSNNSSPNLSVTFGINQVEIIQISNCRLIRFIVHDSSFAITTDELEPMTNTTVTTEPADIDIVGNIIPGNKNEISQYTKISHFLESVVRNDIGTLVGAAKMTWDRQVCNTRLTHS